MYRIELPFYKVTYTVDDSEIYINTINEIEVDQFKERFIEEVKSQILLKLQNDFDSWNNEEA